MAGIEAIDPARAGPIAPSLRDGEKIALLPTARAQFGHRCHRKMMNNVGSKDF